MNAEYVFDSFSNEKAFEIGREIKKIVEEKNKSVAISIEKNGNIIYQYLMDGAQVDNILWIERKRKITRIFGKSSKLVGEIYKEKQKDIGLLYDPKEYQAVGGAFPIILRNTGLIGSITVSGLSSIEDHEVILEAIKKIENSNN